MEHDDGVSSLRTSPILEGIDYCDLAISAQPAHHSEQTPDGSSPPSSNKKRTISGVFSSLRESRSSGATPSSGTASPMSIGKPTIKIFSPGLAKSRRLSSMGSYFARPRGGPQSIAHTPSPNEISPLSTHWEDVMSESQNPAHVRDISEPMSPLSGPVQRLSPSFRPSEATFAPKLHASSTSLNSEVATAMPSRPSNVPARTYKVVNKEQYQHAPHAGPNEAINFLPSEMQRVGTPPLKQKSSGFKPFFFDKQSIPDSSEDEPPDAPTTKRRKALITMQSFQSLVPKVSLPMLKRKRSRRGPAQDIAARGTQRSSTEVTAFYQTPYSQRYSDARRAKIAQIRSYMDEAMRDDDSGADESTMNVPFELNIPDHLPNSPLCPLSPKHKNGEKVICPMHRRRKAGPVGAGESVRGGNGGSGGSQTGKKSKERAGAPVIVFESSQKDGSGRYGIQ